ncbi:MAG TPA: ATP-binding protein [Candidatus Acidoferrum sp.]|nr:ATP-binding protein [Candidatus Acidoferrum sp.]
MSTKPHGFADLLLEKYGATLGEQPQSYLHRINEAATRMSLLIEDLLKLAKVNRQQLSLREVSLGGLVEEVLCGLEAEMANRKIEWRIGNLPSIQCDPGLMRQVLTNLVSNAIKYTRPRDPAIIELREVCIDGESAFLVQDNGVGFDLKGAETLFSPFQRFQ